MTTCLWCNSKTTNNQPFCPGGGVTRHAKPQTGDKDVTKSYCYNDFLTILKACVKARLKLSPAERQYLIMREDVKLWYASLPSPERPSVLEGVSAEHQSKGTTSEEVETIEEDVIEVET